MSVRTQGGGSSSAPEHQTHYARWLEEEEKLADRYQKRPDMSWLDHLIMLLTIAAGVEHCLMVQYLYAAYSLHTEGQSDRRSRLIENWRSNILAVCKEEMGHLLTVQNILLLVRAPPFLGRENTIWAEKYYPYPFSLDPFSCETLSNFVYAEMPDLDSKLPKSLTEEEEDLLRQIKKDIRNRYGSEKFPLDVHRVGKLYEEIIELISDQQRIPDSAFDESTFEFQASWDAWGRGYRPDPYPLDAEGNRIDDEASEAAGVQSPHGWRRSKSELVPRPISEAFVRVDRAATRTAAVNALVAIASQGEAPHLQDRANLKQYGEPSHFERFFGIYRQFMDEVKREPDWNPAKHVCANPTTQRPPRKAGDPPLRENSTPVTAPVSKRLAQLFNQRYRLLLNYLAHNFHIAGLERADRPNLRAMLMHRVFGEMYNLKTLAGLLVRTPRLGPNDPPDAKPKNAGPPFEMPYSLNIPDDDIDIWRAHNDLIKTSLERCKRLLSSASGNDDASSKIKEELDRLGAEPYLRTLVDLDEQTSKWIAAIVAGAA